MATIPEAERACILIEDNEKIAAALSIFFQMFNGFQPPGILLNSAFEKNGSSIDMKLFNASLNSPDANLAVALTDISNILTDAIGLDDITPNTVRKVLKDLEAANLAAINAT